MVYVHLATGFEEIEALTIVDVLRRAEIETQLVSIMDTKRVAGAHGISVEADLLFEEADYEKCQILVLPGGMPGAKYLGEHAGLTEQLRQFEKDGKYVAAICAAPMVLAAQGLLKGRNAVIFPGMEEKLQDAICQSDDIVIDGKIVTSKGPATALPFALYLVEILKGKELADKLAERLLWNKR